MIAVLSLLTVIMISIVLTRIATIALVQTGLARESARFQARSALTGVGFTTDEAERVVRHPVRRRIILGLMLLGNAGIVGAVSSLMLTFLGRGADQSMAVRVVLLVAGLVALWSFASSRWVDRRLSRLTEWALSRWTDLDVRDYASLMHLAGEYRLGELEVEEDDWLAERTLAELALRDEGIIVLGIQRRTGEYFGAPNGSTRLFAGDTLILYGRAPALLEIDERRKGWSGDFEHDQAVAEQEEVAREEQRRDEELQQDHGSIPQKS